MNFLLKMSRYLLFGVAIATLGFVPSSFAQKAAKKTESAQPKKKRQVVISGESQEALSQQGADSSEGWIIKKTKDGKIIKIPKKQTFKFSGGEVSGEANRPNETLLGTRLTPQETTLIPERKSYRSEFLSTVGYTERKKK